MKHDAPKVREHSVNNFFINKNDATTTLDGPQVKWLCRYWSKTPMSWTHLHTCILLRPTIVDPKRLLRCSYPSRVAPSQCPHRNSFVTKTVGYPAKRVIHGCSANACFSKRWMQVTIAERNDFENASWQINTARIFAGPFPRMQANGPATYVQHK